MQSYDTGASVTPQTVGPQLDVIPSTGGTTGFLLQKFPPPWQSSPRNSVFHETGRHKQSSRWRRSLRTVVLSCLAVASCWLAPETAPAATFCVQTARDLRTVLFVAERNGEADVIQIAQGTYMGAFGYASAEPFRLTIEGGHDATCTSRQVNPINTILDAANSGIPLSLTATIASDFVVDGLTLQNGRGGLIIKTKGGQVTISHNAIHNNRTNRGAGLAVTGAPIVLLTGNTIQENYYGVYLRRASEVTLRNNHINKNTGTGLYLPDISQATLVNNTLRDNGGNGLSIGYFPSQVTLTRNTILANQFRGIQIVAGTAPVSLTGNTIRANQETGVFISRGSRVILRNNSVQENGASGIYTQSAGELQLSNNSVQENGQGGVWAFSTRAVVALTQNVITNNAYFGGVYVTGNAPATLTSNIIRGNSFVGGQGGGVYIGTTRQPVTLVNNVISGNSARQGAGIFLNAGSPLVTLTNNTVHGNTATSVGGGVWLALDANNHQADIYNNIIWANTASQGADLYLGNDGNNDGIRSPVHLFDNDFTHSAVFIKLPFPINASNFNNVDPLFVDIANGDYHLQAASPLIDQGNNAAPGLPATDKDGQPRIVGTAVDLGAYESD